MVSGGTYGTEDIVHGAGYGKAILILLLTPLLWSLPTAFMIGELSSALPFEGGYYAWVRRAMGNFWGFQEAWLSLVASIFDMAIYPTLFVAYLTRMFPWFQENHRGVAVALGVVIVCAILNIMGVKVVSTTSLWLFFALSAPFAAIFVLAPFKIHALANAVTKPTTSNVKLRNFSDIDSLSSTRSTAFSPCTVGMIDTRKSISRPLYRTRKRPSCGTRRSAISSSLMTLMRDKIV